MSKFQGFNDPAQNWSKLPHQLIEALPEIKTIGELKVIIYTLRHTWGYQDDYKKITSDEFENGRKRKDGSRIDNGTGLTKPTIVDGIKRAVADGFLFEYADTSDSARVKKFYSLTKEGLKVLTSDVKTFNIGCKESLHRTEKETVKKETIENSFTKNPHKDDLNALASQIAQISRTDIETIGPKTKQALKDFTVSLLFKVDINIKLPKFLPWWYANDWRGQKGQSPTLWTMRDTWGQFEAAQVAAADGTANPGPTLSDEAQKNYDRLIAEQK